MVGDAVPAVYETTENHRRDGGWNAKNSRRETSPNEKQTEYVLNSTNESSTRWSPTPLASQASRLPMF
jgi:hypothetical protein